MRNRLLLMPTAGEGVGPVPPGHPNHPDSIRPQTPATEKELHILEDKQFRLEVELLKTKLKSSRFKSAERTLAYRALQTAKHWLGEDLQELGTENPYPNSMKPNTTVDPTADVPKP